MPARSAEVNYDSVDLDTVWKVVERDIPELLDHLSPLLAN
jgi:uncharacterized protein with HEPN domain